MARVKEINLKEIRFEAFLIFIKGVLISIYKKNRNMNDIKALILMINDELYSNEKKVKE